MVRVERGAREELVVREITHGESLRPFVDLAWTMNAADPCWVAPLRMSLGTALDRRRHPFHRHAEVAYFIAQRDRRPVGRIAAILNRLHNEFHEEATGFFGLFECENRPTTARILLEAAADWLRTRGCDRIRGPMNFSTNEEIASPGILIEGFDTRPAFMMSHNPRYYAELIEQAGFQKSRDLLAFWLDKPDALPARALRSLERVPERHGATVRPIELRHFRRDLDIIKEVYNAAWSRNWGFVPMTDAEFEHLAREFRPIVDPALCLIAEVRGEPIGFTLALPNLNEALRHLPDGRLFPFGLPKFLWHRRRIRCIRVLTLGFKPQFHRAGLGPALYLQTWRNGVARGYSCGEASWILEDNHEMVRALERMGGKPYRRYRLYEHDLA